MTLDRMLQEVREAKANREAQLRRALQARDRLKDQIRADCAELIGSFGGYPMPTGEARGLWIQKRLRTHPEFARKADYTAQLLWEYLDLSRRVGGEW